MRKPVRDHLELDYQGKEIPVRLDMYMDVNHHALVFTYNEVNVNVYFDADESSWWNVGVEHCRLIDKLGETMYKQYCDYSSDIRSFEKQYIVLDNKVYKHFYKTIDGGHKIYHMMGITMEDGQSLDGSPFNNIFDEEKYNKKKTFENLVRRVNSHYKTNNVLPLEKYLLIEETKQYQEMKQWIEECLE